MSESVAKLLPQPDGVGEDPTSHWTRVFARFLQLVFASFDKGNYQWSQDDALSEIVISDQATIKTEVVERRPAILMSRGPMAWANLSIDQFAGPATDANGNFIHNLDPSTGARRHSDLVASTMTYNCLSSEGLEASRIAWITCYATRVLKRALMKAGIHRVGEDITVGSESPPGSIVQPDSNEIVMVSVTVPFFFQDTWTVAPLDKTLLKKLSLALRSEVNAPAPGAEAVREPGIYGRVLTYDRKLSLNTKVTAGPWRRPKPLK